MKNIILIGVLGLILSACGNRKPVHTVPLKISYNEEYCGGTEPSEEMLEQLNTFKPYTGPIYLHSDIDQQRKDKPIIVDIKNGNAELQGLSAGCYFAYSQPMLIADSTSLDPNLIECQNMNRMNPFLIINIYDYTEMVEGSFTITCDPCSPPVP
ncbi:MAG: hypothetical protein JXR19_03945 [Bacteroidia bacterium]